LSTPSEVHALFADNVYLNAGGATGDNRIAELIAAMPVCLEVRRLAANNRQDGFPLPSVAPTPPPSLLAESLRLDGRWQADAALAACKRQKREPTEQEAAVLALADELRNKLVQVDVHKELGPLEQDGYVRPALASTEQRLMASATASFDAARAAASA